MASRTDNYLAFVIFDKSWWGQFEFLSTLSGSPTVLSFSDIILLLLGPLVFLEPCTSQLYLICSLDKDFTSFTMATRLYCTVSVAPDFSLLHGCTFFPCPLSKHQSEECEVFRSLLKISLWSCLKVITIWITCYVSGRLVPVQRLEQLWHFHRKRTSTLNWTRLWLLWSSIDNSSALSWRLP